MIIRQVSFYPSSSLYPTQVGSATLLPINYDYITKALLTDENVTSGPKSEITKINLLIIEIIFTIVQYVYIYIYSSSAKKTLVYILKSNR